MSAEVADSLVVTEGAEPAAAVDLYWLPLGAGGHSVRFNGRIFEAGAALLGHRAACDLYHSALEVRAPEGRFVIEQTPVPRTDGAHRGVVAGGAVGSRFAGHLRIFRYELRRWRDGVIPDIAEAVESPQRLTTDPLCARRVLDLAPSVPTLVWGRDPFGAGEMWNSNSFISWLLERSGLDAESIHPPAGGRAPGWRAGVTIARRTATTQAYDGNETLTRRLPDVVRASEPGDARSRGPRDLDARLPESVRAYLERSLPEGVVPERVRVWQEGVMWKAPGAKPQRFTATEDFAVDRVEFSWRARFPIVRPVALRVTDEYAEGAGHLTVRLLGYPLVRSRGPEVTIGEALRYLAELPLVPYAMGCNRQLTWRDLDGRAVEVSTVVLGKRLAVRLDFDESGDVVRASTPERPHARTGGGYDLLSWGGEYRRHEVLGGLRMPTEAEVYWDMPEGRFVYWRGTITSAEALSAD